MHGEACSFRHTRSGDQASGIREPNWTVAGMQLSGCSPQKTNDIRSAQHHWSTCCTMRCGRGPDPCRAGVVGGASLGSLEDRQAARDRLGEPDVAPSLDSFEAGCGTELSANTRETIRLLRAPAVGVAAWLKLFRTCTLNSCGTILPIP